MQSTIFLMALSAVAGAESGPALLPHLGHGDLRYALDRGWAKADPAVAPIVNAHALAEASDGRIYLVTDHPKNDFIVFEKDGRYVRSISAGLGGGHGLEIFMKDGVEYLAHVDSGWHMAAEGWNPTPVEGRVTILTLDGKVVRRLPTPVELGLKDGKFMPCDVAWTPSGTLLIADGYGSNLVYELTFEGKLVRKWGGPTKDAANLSNAHGISIDVTDPRGPLVWVPSRAQNQIKAFTPEGRHVDTLDLPGAFAGQLFFRGDRIYTAVCWSKDAQGKRPAKSGFLLVLDRATRKVLSAPGGEEPRYVDGKLQPLRQAQPVFVHGHDLYVDSAGDIYLGEWNADRRYPSKLTLLR
ncbi:MAG: 6-bladed beta-propeller [Verrucomicrobia bacterium]|nr:6-bladed beta-propeller [Verrucomicrobiota bacterium]